MKSSSVAVASSATAQALSHFSLFSALMLAPFQKIQERGTIYCHSAL
jgi:hypothetical protein